MNTNYQFVKEWPEDTNIAWWNEGRHELNKVIRLYNKWQVDGFSELGLQTFANVDGGSGWRDQLDEMKKFVEGCNVTT